MQSKNEFWALKATLKNWELILKKIMQKYYQVQIY